MDQRILIACLLVSASASAAPQRIRVTNAWTRPALAGMNAAGYMTFANRAPVPDRLDGASSPLAARVTLHQSRMVGSVSVMRPAAGVPVPSHGQASLSPGGFHLMMEGLKRPLKPGERAPVTLEFQRAGPVRAWLTVRGGAPVSPGMKM